MSYLCVYVCLIVGTEFTPKPEVNVGIVRCVPRVRPLIEGVQFNIIERLVRYAFQQRRKALAHSLSPLFPASRPELVQELFKQSGVTPTLFPVNLSVQQFASLCQVSF